jgi:hypothetical protein
MKQSAINPIGHCWVATVGGGDRTSTKLHKSQAINRLPDLALQRSLSCFLVNQFSFDS